MEKDKGIGACFCEVARRHPEFPAIVLRGAGVSYRELWSVVRRFALRMKELGVNRHGIVALNTSDPLVSIAALLASALLGSQFVVAGPNLARTKALQPTLFLRSAEMDEGRRRTYHLIDETWWPEPEQEADFSVAEFEPVDLDAPWLAQHTSGTTGTPKYLSLSQRIVLNRTAAIAGDFPHAATTVAMLFSATSRPFQARAIGALLNACTIVTGADLAQWRRCGVNYICGSPLQAAEFFRSVEPARKFQRIETSGGRLSEPDAAVLLDHFKTVIDIYGASETNKTFATLIERGPDGTILRIGRPLDSEVQVVDRNGQPCPVEVTGTVRVRNGYMVPGYIGQPDQTAKVFRDGWFYPGDIGHWTPRGALEVIGREDDLMSVGGVKVYATLIDLMMSVVPGVQEAICFKNPKAGAADELLAFVKFDPLVNRADCIERIRQSITDKFGVMLPIRNIHAIDAIPRNENGKPLRAVAQKMILEKVATLSAERQQG
ncbi:class I adenylate-forming enzyme family protein [Tabrizicola soli]|uniref:Class I adenylate-forming enzyme family protein n=1 Tax=Tabrizicola soli TaxID=2185115 RepID=A0ABV7E008_9RHOB